MQRYSILFIAILSILAALLFSGSGCTKDETCGGMDAGICDCPSCGGRSGGDDPSPPPDDIGDICAHDSDCAQHCLLGLSGMAPYCTRSCESDSCPAGYLCLSVAQAGMVCAIGPCGGDGQCPEGYSCSTDDPDNPVCLHEDVVCDSDSDCPAATACNQGLCELLCESDDDCKQGFRCRYRRRCVKCTNNSHCEDGYSCQDGNCNLSCIEDNDCRIGFRCAPGACEQISGGGNIEMGAADAGCEEDTDCVDFCYNGEYCTRICEGEDDPACPEGYACHGSHLFCRMQ